MNLFKINQFIFIFYCISALLSFHSFFGLKYLKRKKTTGNKNEDIL